MDWHMNHPWNPRDNSRHPSFLDYHPLSHPRNARYDMTLTKPRHHPGGSIPALQPNTEAEVLCLQGVPLSYLWIR